MRALLSSRGWVFVSDLLGLSLFAALLAGGTGSPIFAALLLVAPVLLLSGMLWGPGD